MEFCLLYLPFLYAFSENLTLQNKPKHAWILEILVTELSATKELKGQSAKFLSFNMLIGALDGAHVQNLCSVPHFNPKL